jgi:hypothetical protein
MRLSSAQFKAFRQSWLSGPYHQPSCNCLSSAIASVPHRGVENSRSSCHQRQPVVPSPLATLRMNSASDPHRTTTFRPAHREPLERVLHWNGW